MASQLTTALQITVVGMGLVFGAILLLWGVMAALVRLLAPRAQVDVEADARLAEIRRRAAAAAVAVALVEDHQHDLEPHEFPLPPTALVSAWQAVMRTKMLNKRGPVR